MHFRSRFAVRSGASPGCGRPAGAGSRRPQGSEGGHRPLRPTSRNSRHEANRTSTSRPSGRAAVSAPVRADGTPAQDASRRKPLGNATGREGERRKAENGDSDEFTDHDERTRSLSCHTKQAGKEGRRRTSKDVRTSPKHRLPRDKRRESRLRRSGASGPMSRGRFSAFLRHLRPDRSGCRRRAVPERPFCGRVSRERKDSGRGSGNANGFPCRPRLADRSASLAALGQPAARPVRGCQSWTDSRRETPTGGCRQLASTSTISRQSRAESPDAPGIRKFCRMAGRAKSRPGDRATMSGADPPPAGSRRSAEHARFPAETAAFRAQAPRLHPPGAASARASAASTDGGPRLARDRKRRKAQTMQPVQPVAPIARHAATAAFRAVLQASRRAHGGSETAP